METTGSSRERLGDPADVNDHVVAAVHWCRIGAGPHPGELPFLQAKRMGLLAQDPVWRATPEGEALLRERGMLP